MGKRAAVLIGCNYPGTKAELKGCINDVNRMYCCLLDRYGFKKNDITVLIDTDQSYTQPTGKNIRRALQTLVRSAEPGDVLFNHYSGHGARLPPETGEPDDTGYDECIVPTDMNLITDEDFKELVCQVPDGCRITIVSDSCHSGGLISGAKEQIGESTKSHHEDHHHHHHHSGFSRFFKDALKEKARDAFESRGIRLPSISHHHSRHTSTITPSLRKTIIMTNNGVTSRASHFPYKTLIDILKEKTGKDDIDIGHIRPSLFDIFGEDSSPKVKKFMKFILDKIHLHKHQGEEGSHGGLLSTVGGLALEFLKQKLEENNDNGVDYVKPVVETEVENTEEVYAGSTIKKLRRNGILLSGCQTDQTSADTSPSGNDNEAYGAFSNAIQTILRESGEEISNEEIVMKARKLLKRQGFKQRPGLYCDDQFVEVPFVC